MINIPIKNPMIDDKQTILNMKGKHIKSLLTKLEAMELLTPAVRKIILDEMNDMARELLISLGYEE